MTSVIQSASTVEEAIEQALQQLNVSRKDVEIDIQTEGRKGFLGIGARPAEVKVTVIQESEPITEETLPEVEQTIQREETIAVIEEEAIEREVVVQEEVPKVIQIEKDPEEEAIAYLTAIAKEMQIDDLQVTTESDGKYFYFQLESEKAALLIGKRGQTLNALQQLTQLVANQHSERFKVVRLNVGDYRERRKQSLARLAERMADKAIHTNRKIQLEPMTAFERKVIHHTLSNRLDIETYSEGTDPHRYLVIEPIR